MQFDGITWPPFRGIQDGEYKLKRTKDALVALGNPHEKLANIIHIAGTNGKGSVSAFLQNVLNEYGFSCNVYTSPHLVKVNERIKVRSQDIPNDKILKYTKEVYCTLKNVGLENSLTFFEGITVVMFYIFAKEKADFNIIEVGLGGRWDATNVIVQPLLSIITSISLDHQDYLGNTLEAIAVEKCEIIKPNSHAIMGFQEKESIYDAFKSKCGNVGIVHSVCKELEFFNNKLDNSYQKQNATLTLKALDIISTVINVTFERQKCVDVITNTQWRGRMQNVFLKEFNREILVDCAHNFGGICQFLQYIQTQNGTRVLILGMLQRKVNQQIYDTIKQALCERDIENVITVNFGGTEECVNSQTLAEFINHENCIAAENFNDAILLAAKFDSIFLCGSIYMVGDFFQTFGI
jgi:dihydrofolate synthase/folylpolyglutamate synthase